MKIQAKIRTFLAENLVTLRRAPVEMAVAAYLFVIGVLAQHHVFPYSGEQLLAGPIVLLLTFLCNKWFAKGWLRALYYLSGLAVIPFRWADMGEWIENPAYYVTIIIGLLAGLLCGWHKDNRRFTEDLLRYVWDGISALFLTGVAYLLLLAIFFSIVYIFGIFKGITSDFCADAALLFFIVLWPLVFLTFNRKSEPAEPESSKLLDTLLNWVLSPAVLAYTVLLYLYFAKIVATWSLPRGGIAYLVFGFTLIAVAAQAGQTLLNKRYYDWFYNRFSLISLPALAMFWVGVGCRWSDYGLSENRVYLIACGLIMTACMGLFLSRRTGRYLYVTLTAIVILALFTYIPGLTPRDIERWSQSGRPADRQDKSYRDDDKAESFYLWWEPLTEGIDLKGYSRLYEMRHWYSEDKPTPHWESTADSLFLYDGSNRVLLRESLGTILERQLSAIGYQPTDSIPEDTLQLYLPQLLTYRSPGGKVCFERINLSRDSVMRIDDILVKYYFEK